MRVGPGPHQRIYQTPEGQTVDVLVPRDQGQFPGGSGSIGQVIVYLPTVDETGAKIVSQVIWDRVPADWTLIETTEEDDPDNVAQPQPLGATEPLTAAPTADPGSLTGDAPGPSEPTTADPQVAYDPAEHTVEETIEFAKTIDEQSAIESLIVLETQGQNRSTLIDALTSRIRGLDAITATSDGEGDGSA